MGRSVHFVGSIPGTDVAEVMTQSLRRAGSTVRSITDGEIGERRNWIISSIDSFKQHPDLEMVRSASWSSYKDIPRYQIRPGHPFGPEHLDLPQLPMFKQNFPIFQKVRSQVDMPHLAFQVGIPGDLDLSLFTFGPIGGFRHREPFAEALGDAMAKIHQAAGDDVIFQIELPVELVFVIRMPGPAQAAMASMLARGTDNVVRRAPEGSRFGIHLCVGDMNHQPLGHPKDTTPIVRLANALIAQWPAGRPLEFLHVPLAAADEPPTLDPMFYTALRRLRLPERTRFIAGIVHEDRSIDELRRIRDIVEEQVGREVDVATSCGLGRRSPQRATETIDLARELAKA